MNKLSSVICAVFGFFMLSVSYAAPVNINTAAADAIATNLKGVGPKQAAAIVEYRELNGPFSSIDELSNVKGIGAKTIANNQDNILLENTEKMPSAPAKTVTKAVSQQMVNINTASADELTALQGIGPAKAVAIIKYREEAGPFQAFDELLNVKGIGEKTLMKNRDMILLQ